MYTQIQTLTRQLNEAGFSAKIWQDRRIYLNGQDRDTTAYIQMDEGTAHLQDFDTEEELLEFLGGDIMAGCALKVFINCNQSQAWLRNRYKQQKHKLMKKLANAEIVKAEVCESWEDVV